MAQNRQLRVGVYVRIPACCLCDFSFQLTSSATSAGRIEMRQLPLVFKSKSARSNGYERTALVANPADEEDVEPE